MGIIEYREWRPRELHLAVLICLILLVQSAQAVSFSPVVSPLIREAERLSASGQYRQAKAKLKDALKVERGKEQRMDIRIRQCNLYLDAGKVERGRELLRKMLNKVSDPAIFIALSRALMYYHPIQRDEARRLLDVVIRRDPQNWNALVELGYCEFYDGKIQEAAANFQKAIAVENEAVQAFMGLADCHFASKEFQAAIIVLEKAFAFAPKDARLPHRIGDCYLASALEKRMTKAITWYDKALKLNASPKYMASLMMVFFARLTAGDGKPIYEKIKEINPHSTYVNWADGVFLELKGQIGQALKHYEEAVRKDPRNWLAHFSRANIYAGRGNVEYVRWAENENHRYGGHGNREKATEAYEAIKAGAPSFPYIGVVDDYFASGSDVEQEQNASARSRKTSKSRRRIKRSGRAVSSGMY